jgi:hypothetical protein
MTRGDHYLSCRAAPAPAPVDRERCRRQILVVEPRRRSFEIGFWLLWSASCAVKSSNAASRHAACVRRSRTGQRRHADCATKGNGSSSAYAGRKTRAGSFLPKATRSGSSRHSTADKTTSFGTRTLPVRRSRSVPATGSSDLATHCFDEICDATEEGGSPWGGKTLPTSTIRPRLLQFKTVS